MRPLKLTRKKPSGGGPRSAARWAGAAMALVLLGGCGLFGGGDERVTLTRPELTRPAGGFAGIVQCASTTGGYAFCPADTGGGVTLVRQVGATRCDLNRSWGFDSRGIWVDLGCAGEFQLGSAPMIQTAESALTPPVPVPYPGTGSVAQAAPQTEPMPQASVPQPSVSQTPVTQAAGPQAAFSQAAAPAGRPPQAMSYRYGSAGRDEAVQACEAYTDLKARALGATSAHIDRVIRVGRIDRRHFEVQAYIRADYDKKARKAARRRGQDPRSVLYVECTALRGQVTAFQYDGPV